jgi:AcrR family transcriptional regulator
VIVTNQGLRTDRRARLVNAASELFTERAYDEVTTVEIAKRAGVAYGLIAHHFINKRGLYLETVRAAADRLRAVRDTAPAGDTLLEKVRDAIGRTIRYIDKNSAQFAALMHGGLGSDPEVQAIIEELRWESAQHVLAELGVSDPVSPILRTAMAGWVGYLYAVVLERLVHPEVPQHDLIELVAGTLVSSLRMVVEFDPNSGLDAEILAELS